jgi:glycine/D-amino acid oxidase-like deaminating enzyme
VAVAEAADAVVVGAGVIGCSVALELARLGRRVVVVDRLGGPGQGSTSASSAIVRFHYSTYSGVATAWEAYHCWLRWEDHLEGSDPEGMARYVRTGMVMLDVPVVPRERSLALLAQVGVPFEEWDAQTLRERVAGIDPGAYWPNKRVDDEAFWTDARAELGAFFTPDAGYVSDPQLAALNLAEAGRRRGVAFRLHRAVTRVDRRGGRVSGVTLDDGSAVSAPVVVNVAGPWSSQLNALAGVGDGWTVQSRPLRQEVHHVPAPHGPDTIVADLDLGTYLRPAPGGGLLVGGTEPECDGLQWVDDPDALDPRPTQEVFTAQVTRAARRFPSLGVPGSAKGVVGLYDVTPDWTPVYDRTELDGYYVAMGTSGNQFKNAPLAGRFLAAIVDRVESGHDHDADPVQYVGEHTGRTVDLGSFSRKRPRNTASSGTVMG